MSLFQVMGGGEGHFRVEPLWPVILKWVYPKKVVNHGVVSMEQITGKFGKRWPDHPRLQAEEYWGGKRVEKGKAE